MDIFAQGKSLNPSFDFKWVGFNSVGDKYQGVFIGTVKGNDSFGNPQTTYLIEQPDKSVLGVGMKDTKTKFHELMSGVKIGQYVGFVYSKDLDCGKPNKAKIVEIVTDPNAVDPNWANKGGINTSMVENNDDHYGVGVVPNNIFDNVAVAPAQVSSVTPSQPVQPAATSVSDKISKIMSLAKEKMQVVDATDAKAKVVAQTGLQFTPDNLDNIILQLEML